MKKEIPNSLLWIFESYDLKNRNYLKDLDFIRENTAVNHITVSVRNGVQLQNTQQCHGVMKELVEYAHRLGLKVSLHLTDSKGFYNAIFSTGNVAPVDQVEVFPIPDPEKAAAIINDIELVADESGFAQYTFTAQWGRSKIMPIYSDILKAYAFEKTKDGFYRPGSLSDVTDSLIVTDSRTAKTSFEIHLGKENTNKNIFVLLAQYYNYPSMADAWDDLKNLMDAYSDIPLDGITMDEYGYLPLNTEPIKKGIEPPFRGRHYSKGMDRYYRETLRTDLPRLLFDMRYAPEGDEKCRIKAINTYFETLRHFPLKVEKNIYAYTKQLFGEDAYVSCHNTFHNNLDNDEIWRTACNWWDIPREFGHTDENICFPVRWGLMLACNHPLMFDMYYAKKSETHYDHIIEGAPYNCREFHHAFNDFYWGSSFRDAEFLKNIRYLDETVATLNDFQTVYPKMDLLVIFGAAAQNNWYPNYESRNLWDIDGSLKIMEKCKHMWDAGYRCALAPDYAIEDGRITRKGDQIYFGGYAFSQVLFLYPKYAKAETYAFLNDAHRQGVKLAVVGNSNIDFDGNAAQLDAPCFEDFSIDILTQIGCSRSAIDHGCVYADGSFALVTDGLLTNKAFSYDFELGGKRIHGSHTGLLAYRKGQNAFATKGSTLFIDGDAVTLTYLEQAL